MILTVDIGNTIIAVGGFEGDMLAFVVRLATNIKETSHEYAAKLDSILRLSDTETHSLTAAVISSVVPQLTGTIREALKKLISEGLVVYRPRVGYSVRNLTLHEYLQVSEILQVIETHLVKELAKIPFIVDITALRAINRELAECLPAGGREMIGAINDRFHEKIYENYHNKLMTGRLNSLWLEARAPRNLMYDNKVFTNRIVAEHEAIISAIERGDPAAAEAAISVHYVSGRESAIIYFPVEA
ncbi:type III pantothenate kinase [uncultured Cloacibacillus sp.]|uniref:type III pantothenate kinase n=1 Tax=uncultured Cloacibacillus sp. TaxID=889794 RepID=UPI0025864FBE|nr:type III pantothenate kinase [uncultured Cloacibacillus sp.]